MTLISFYNQLAISSGVMPATKIGESSRGYSRVPFFKTVNSVDSRVGRFESLTSRTSPTPTRYTLVGDSARFGFIIRASGFARTDCPLFCSLRLAVFWIGRTALVSPALASRAALNGDCVVLPLSSAEAVDSTGVFPHRLLT